MLQKKQQMDNKILLSYVCLSKASVFGRGFGFRGGRRLSPTCLWILERLDADNTPTIKKNRIGRGGGFSFVCLLGQVRLGCNG